MTPSPFHGGLLLASLLLAGCESTSFQAPPVAESACPPALAADWVSVGDGNDPDGDVVLHIDRQCQLRLDDRNEGEMRTGEATRLHVGADGDIGYFWVDADWAGKRFGADLTAPAGDIMLARYRIEANELIVQLLDDRAIAHRLIDNKLRGDVRQIDGHLNNRVLAPVDPKDLRDATLYDADAARFRKAMPEARP